MTEAPRATGQMTVYGSKISYFTGKFETYLRLRRIPYRLLPTTAGPLARLKAETGTTQMPVVHLGDDRWMTDTTPMIAWLEARFTGDSVYPADPVLNVIALLIEDYADEWLWRPAMHYRWSFGRNRRYAADALFEELIRDHLWMPRPVGMNYLKYRQLTGFVWGDGITRQTRTHAENSYLAVLDRLESIFARRPFILGQAPTVADVGLMGPMLRHFSQDPTPAEIMRNSAPGVYEWVARMWNLDPASLAAPLIDAVDEPLRALLTEACQTHLVHMTANAEAFGQGRDRFDVRIQGCAYARLPASRYRVWCLEQLRDAVAALSTTDRHRLASYLAAPEAAILFDNVELPLSGYDPEKQAPFNRAIHVFSDGIPGRKRRIG